MPEHQMARFAVISVGTEITSGQILNRNSYWLSEKLTNYGFFCTYHLAVPDDFNLIYESLQFVRNHCDFLFVTGGLGPTSDDFTRNVISHWSQKKLTFDQSSWQHLEQQLTQRGLHAKDIHKQECSFPAGAKILKNSAGTANGFQIDLPQMPESSLGKENQLSVFVLPGPPMEISAIWNDHLSSFLLEKIKKTDRLVVKKWQTIGQPESEIANLILQNFPESKFEISYRIHLPYVEVKVSYLESQDDSANSLIQQIDLLLKPYSMFKNEENIDTLLLNKYKCVDSISIADEYCGHYLLDKISSLQRALSLQKPRNDMVIDYTQTITNDPQHYDLVIRKQRDNLVFISARHLQIIVESLLRNRNLPERQRQFVSEVALLALASHEKISELKECFLKLGVKIHES